MSVIIRLQGLSWSASAMDIRNFFKGLSIPPGGVRIIGGENGDAFIAFSTDEDARQAMMLTNKPLNDSPVQLFLSSKTEMQNTITQAKDKAPNVDTPAAPAVSTNIGTALLSQQIPSAQQISQVFPAVGQIMGTLGIQQPQAMQTNQFQGGFQRSHGNIQTSAGFLDNSNINSLQSKGKSVNQYEHELPGEYSVGGIQGLNKQLDVKSITQGPLSFGDQLGPVHNSQSSAMNQGFPASQQQVGSSGPKDNFRGEIYNKDISPAGLQNQPWESRYQQQNLNQNNPNVSFGNKQSFNNQSGHGKPLHGVQNNLNSQQYGHGKPFQSENSGMNNLQPFPGIRPNFPPNRPSDPFFHSTDLNFLPNNRPGESNFPHSSRLGESNFAPSNRPDETIFQSSGRVNDMPSSRPADMNFPQRNKPNNTSYSHGSQLNVPPTSRSSFPPVSHQDDPKLLATSRPFDTSIQDKSSITPRNRQSASRFSSATVPSGTNFPPMSRPNDSKFAQSSQPKDPYSAESLTKSAAARAEDTRSGTVSTTGKPNVPGDKVTSGLMLSNKRDAFGRNVPFAAREGNVSNPSSTPTQDEKYEDSRSRDSSDTRFRDPGRRSSRDRDRSRDRSSRRDSPRDRERRERDRSRRDRDDDRRSRRDREKDRDRDRKRDRDNDKYDKTRDSKDRDRRSSPASDSNRKMRKRSLSPSSKNKNDNEKKIQVEKPGQSPTVNQAIPNNKPKTSVVTSDSSGKSVDNTSGLLDTDVEKKGRTGAHPLFPVVSPQKSGGRGLLGEAPASLPGNKGYGFGNLNQQPLLKDNLDRPNVTGFGNDGPRVGVHGGPLLDNPMENVPKDLRGHGPLAGFPGRRVDRAPPSDNSQSVREQSQTFEYGHSDGMMGQTNRDRPFYNRPDREPHLPRDDYMNTNEPPADVRGRDRDVPPFDQPEFSSQHSEKPGPYIDNQQRPGFNRGRGGRDGPPPFIERNQRDMPYGQRGVPPFDDRRQRDFRGPPQGPSPDISPRGSNMAPPFDEGNNDFQGRDGRRSLLGDGGAQHDFRGRPDHDRFHDRSGFDDGVQRDERFRPDIRRPHQGQYDAHGRPFNDRNTNERQAMPSLLDDIPFGNRREFQGRPGREPLQRRDGPPPEFRDEPSFRDNDDRNMFAPPGNIDSRVFPPRGRQGPEDFRGPDDFRGRYGDDRHFSREQVESRADRWPAERGFERIADDIRGPNMGPQNNYDVHRDDDRIRMQSDRDRDRRPFDRDMPSFERERGNFDRQERYDNRSGRYQDRTDTTRDRSVERGRGDRNKEQLGERSGRDRSSLKDENRRDIDKTSSTAIDKASSTANDKNVPNVNNEQQNDIKKDANPSDKNVDSKENKSATEVSKGNALCSVVLENIPVETTYKDIRRLFAGLELPKDGIKIINNKEGKRIGKAFVRFGSQDSFKKGIQKDRSRLGNKIMIIKPVPRKEFDNAIDSYLPTDDDDDDDGPPDLDMCYSLSATLRALKGEPELKMPKKSATPNTKDFVVKITLLPEYAKLQNIKAYFQDLKIAKNGEAIVIESSRFKTCTGLCYVEFADESSFKKALNMKKMLDRKAIKITHGSRKEMDDLMNKMKTETNNKTANKKTGGNRDEEKSSKNENIVASKKSEGEKNQTRKTDTDKTSKDSKDSSTTSAEPSKSTPVKVPPACTCLRVRNIPKTMKVFELRSFFDTKGVSVKVAQICHDAVGKAIGEGYVEFLSNSDVEKSLVKNETYVGKNKITVEPVTKTEMIENMRCLRQSLQPEAPTTQAVFYFVKASNLPKTVSTGEIMNFFSGYNPAPESIRLNIGDGSEPSDCSTSLVGFRTREQAETAIASTNGNLLRNKHVTLSKVIL